MSNAIDSIDASMQPIVFAREGEAFANSRDIAAYFGKRHHHVLDSVDNLVKQVAHLGLTTFRETPYVDQQNGQTYRSFDLTRDGFALLAMGFTGAKAIKFKIAYIQQFNAMEAELHGPTRRLRWLPTPSRRTTTN